MTVKKLLLGLLCLFSLPLLAQVKLIGENYVQGGMLIGQAPSGSQVWQDNQLIRVSQDGAFLIGFGRDMPPESTLKVQYPDGTTEQRTLTVKAREYRIQRINNLPSNKVTPRSEKDIQHIQRDIKMAKAARKRDDDRQGFNTGFIWPVTGPISGVYGSQRILNGQPRRPHYGIDIARPTGTPIVAPADGVITLAEPNMFFSGGTMIIDHGHKLSSAMLHLHKLHVKVGDQVKQGQVIAEVGATGRVTGPHLDWRMNLRQHRIDPELLVPPMPKQK